MKMIILRAELMGVIINVYNANVQQCRRAQQGKLVKLHNYDLIYLIMLYIIKKYIAKTMTFMNYSFCN